MRNIFFVVAALAVIVLLSGCSQASKDDFLERPLAERFQCDWENTLERAATLEDLAQHTLPAELTAPFDLRDWRQLIVERNRFLTEELEAGTIIKVPMRCEGEPEPEDAGSK